MFKILVCGGRDFGHIPGVYHKRENKWYSSYYNKKAEEYRFIFKTLDSICNEFSKEVNPNDNWLPTDIMIVSGGSSGVDSAAIDFAVSRYCPFEEYYADWTKYGKAAGPIRNKLMLDEQKPDLVVAFPGGKGTENMISIAEKDGVPVRRINYDI